MRTPLVAVVLTLVLTTCSSGGQVHIRQVPSPTPHKIVMIG